MVLGGRHGRYARAGVVAALLVALASIWLTATAEAGDAGRCDRFVTGSAERAALVTGSGTETLVIGDSWSAGLGLADLGDSWPTRLPGRVRVAGFSGSGFSREASECGDVSFARRASTALTPATGLVVVEGGLNDVDRTDQEIAAGFGRLTAALEGRRVVVVGPAPAPARAEAAGRVDVLLAGLADGAGWEYVSAYDWGLGYLPDRLHLTPEGHRVFGDLVAAAVS